ncbi:MAG TPA: DUF1772 domain-containing protein [Pyrinomonadaceae bacterium]|nr:DUF1772 domain-containing protein [Pyrinomonadaceae bacterium]
MTKRPAAVRVILWLYLLSLTILIGGGIFEHVVLTPLWAGSPPESVTAWQHGVVQAKFFGIASPLYGFFSLALIIASFRMPSRQRKWALAAGICGIAVMLSTIFFFVPILSKTQATRGAGLSGEEITRLTNQFVNWNYGRYVLMIGGWIAALRAITLSSSGEPR